jgi:hypothetical protein
MLIMTEEFADDLGRIFCSVESDRLLFVTGNLCIRVKNIFGLTCSRVLCVLDKTVILFSVLCG